MVKHIIAQKFYFVKGEGSSVGRQYGVLTSYAKIGMHPCPSCPLLPFWRSTAAARRAFVFHQNLEGVLIFVFVRRANGL